MNMFTATASSMVSIGGSRSVYIRPDPLNPASLHIFQKCEWKRYEMISRANNLKFRRWANSNASRSNNANFDIVMVDPVEAKKLAAKQMQEIKAKETLKRQRRIEAFNGAWAMIGLTIGLTIEGQTGQSFLNQLLGYWHALVHFFER